MDSSRPSFFVSSSVSAAAPPFFVCSSAASSSNSPSSVRAPPSVVVTRAAGKNTKLIHSLERHGINCLELPLVKHVRGPDFGLLPSLLKDTPFDWIVITSPEGGSVFLKAWMDAGAPHVNVSAIGGGTARVFDHVEESHRTSFNLAFQPSKGSGRVLCSELPMLVGGNCRVLYPASLNADKMIGSLLPHACISCAFVFSIALGAEEGLSERRFEVTRLNTYETIPVEVMDRNILQRAISIPVVSFASPSAVSAWGRLIGGLGDSWGNMLACIGETTAAAAREMGFQNIYFSEDPGLEGWVRAILRALAGHKGRHKLPVIPRTDAYR